MSGYKTVEFFYRGQLKRVVCDGPEGPSALTAIYNCSSLVHLEHQQAPVPYVEEQQLKQSLHLVLDNMFTVLRNVLEEDPAILTKQHQHLGKLIDSHSTDPVVRLEAYPESISSLEETDLTSLVMYLGMKLLHGWVLDPVEERDIYCSELKLYTYDNLQLALAATDDFEPEDANAAKKLKQVEDLVSAAKNQCTRHGYISLLCQMTNGTCAVYYRNKKLNVIHKNDAYLLILETDQRVLDRFPGITWRVFEEVEGDSIYLTSEYLLVSNQPNPAKAQQWFKYKGLSNNKEHSNEPAGKQSDGQEVRQEEKAAGTVSDGQGDGSLLSSKKKKETR